MNQEVRTFRKGPGLDRILTLELVRVTEAAALQAARLVGMGYKEAADQAAVDGMHAVLHTIQVFGIDLEDFRSFLDSMAMDLVVSTYDTYDDLLSYMEGSAAVIGTNVMAAAAPTTRACRTFMVGLLGS